MLLVLLMYSPRGRPLLKAVSLGEFIHTNDCISSSLVRPSVSDGALTRRYQLYYDNLMHVVRSSKVSQNYNFHVFFVVFFFQLAALCRMLSVRILCHARLSPRLAWRSIAGLSSAWQSWTSTFSPHSFGRGSSNFSLNDGSETGRGVCSFLRFFLCIFFNSPSCCLVFASKVI